MIDSVRIGPRREFALEISLCPVHYPSHSAITLRMGGIINFTEVTTFAESLQKIFKGNESSGRLWTINGFEYDAAHESTASMLFLILDVEHAGRLQIQCTKMTFGEQCNRP